MHVANDADAIMAVAIRWLRNSSKGFSTAKLKSQRAMKDQESSSVDHGFK